MKNCENNYEILKQLPEDIFLIIFGYLDNESLWNAIFVSEDWAKIISNSSKFVNNLVLNLNDKELETALKYPIISIKSIVYTNRSGYLFPELFADLLEIFKKYGNTVENVTFFDVSFKSEPQISELLVPLYQMKTCAFKQCSIIKTENIVIPQMPFLKYVNFDRCTNEFFKAFHGQKFIEKVAVNRPSWGNDISIDVFDNLTKSLPNLKELVMHGHGTAFYFDDGLFPFKIEKLEAFVIGSYWECHEPRLRFLQSQKGHLKELKLLRLPYDYDGDQVLKFIIEEMGLKTLYYRDVPLILDGIKQDVKEFAAKEFQINSIYEMFRQFPEIQKFTMILTRTVLFNTEEAQRLVNPPTTLFRRAKILEIKDLSEDFRFLTTFKGLYKNFTNIQKLIISTEDSFVNSVLEQCLMNMTMVNEVILDTNVKNARQRFETIKTLAPNLKKISVTAQFLDEANNFFRSDNIEITELIFDNDF